MKNSITLVIIVAVALLVSCRKEVVGSAGPDDAKLIFERMAYPSVTSYGGKYYFLGQEEDVRIHAAGSLDSLEYAEPHLVMEGPANGMDHIWAPELARIDGKWYIYFEADDGNTDNHQLYVLENPSEDPLKGSWTLHGPIITNEEWNFGIHPSTFMAGGRQYLLWSGWEHRRAETETQCIFIAEMENPWTLRSPRILISRPEYEWERQWINPDGTRAAYPIFVNENPEPMVSPDSSRVAVAYSASGIWTPYCTIGLLYADTSSDLLDPASWTKLPEPQSSPWVTEGAMTGISNVSAVRSPGDGRYYLLFQSHDLSGGDRVSRVYAKEFAWSPDTIPVLGL